MSNMNNDIIPHKLTTYQKHRMIMHNAHFTQVSSTYNDQEMNEGLRTS